MVKKISDIQNNLDWLFKSNKDKNDFINYLKKNYPDIAKITSDLVDKLKHYNIKGIQEKFSENMGFNGDISHVNFLSKIKELEVGLFLAGKGERVQFLEGQNSPDLISGISCYNRIWEVKTIYDSQFISNLFINGNEIIRSWNKRVEVKVGLSLSLSGFLPRRNYHGYHNNLILEKQNLCKLLHKNSNLFKKLRDIVLIAELL